MLLSSPSSPPLSILLSIHLHSPHAPLHTPTRFPPLHLLVSSLIQYLRVSYSLSRGGTGAGGGVWTAVYGRPPVVGGLLLD